MKKNYLKLVTAALGLSSALVINAQTVADFENLTLASESYWNGDDLSGSFESGNIFFPNEYNTEWDFWNKGFAYSNMTDTQTPGSANIFSSFAGGGNDGSANFGIGKGGSILHLVDDAAGKSVSGFYVTNTTYTAISMRDGDMFAKQFGTPYDANGVDDGTDGKDWFLLTVKGYYNGTETPTFVEFYLADFRSDDAADHYILDTWEWVDLTPLGNVDSVKFELTSTDVGDWGMNTPSFFAMDDFITNDSPASNTFAKTITANVFPNPTQDFIRIESNEPLESVSIYDLNGRLVFQNSFVSNTKLEINLAHLNSGIYVLKVQSGKESFTKRVVKN
jgi:hypothetical protein